MSTRGPFASHWPWIFFLFLLTITLVFLWWLDAGLY